MWLIVTWFFSSLLAFGTSASFTWKSNYPAARENDRLSDAYEEQKDADSPRERRAMVTMLLTLGIKGLQGNNAAKSVLRGAKPVSSQSNWYREYLKTGGNKEALEDFYKARPTHVNDYTLADGVHVKSGEIGDRQIIVKSRSSTGSEPTLEIIKKFKIRSMTMDSYIPGQELVDKITYTYEGL